MSKPEQRLDKLLPEMTVKDKVKYLLHLKNTAEVSERVSPLPQEPFWQEHSRLYDSINGKDIPLVQRQQKEFMFLSLLIRKAEQQFQDAAREARLVLMGLAHATEAIWFQARVNLVVRHVLNHLTEGESIFGSVRRPLSQEEFERVKREEEQAVLPLSDILDVMTRRWCEERGFKRLPWPPLDFSALRESETEWEVRYRAWRMRGYAAFKDVFPSEEAYQRWADGKDYGYGFVVSDTDYERQWQTFAEELERLIKQGVLVAAPCSEEDGQRGIVTNSWVEYLQHSGRAQDSYLLGKYLYQEQYYVAAMEEVEGWRKATSACAEWLRSISSEQDREVEKTARASCLWWDRCTAFLREIIEQLNEQWYAETLHQTVAQQLSAKHFDGEPVIPPYLQRQRDRLQTLRQSIVEVLTDVLASPWMQHHQIAPPALKPLDERDVQAVVRSIESSAMLEMLDWADDRRAVSQLLEARHKEATELYDRHAASVDTDKPTDAPAASVQAVSAAT